MSELAGLFERTRAEGRAALIGYLPSGYPDYQASLSAYGTLVSAGADIVEVGVPYSDPVMDGPTVEKAAEQALASGFRVRQVFDSVAAVATAGAVPVVMSYWNPILKYGVDAFARDLAAVGGAGVITPNLIPDEAQEWVAAAERHGIDPIFLVAPSSTPERLAMTVDACRGFVYAASTMGVTGARDEVSSMAPALTQRVREISDIPVGVGLGIRSRAQAAEVAAYADGVIVGSALVSALAEGEQALATLTAELALGVRQK